MGICRCVVFFFVFVVACFTGTTHVFYPILLPMQAVVWVVTNISEPVANVSGANCWRVCEVELFSDTLCQTRLAPYMWVSSNGLPVGGDAGLRFVQDRNFAGGSMCMNDWRPSNCWEPIKLDSLSCGVTGTCPASRRLELEAAGAGRRW
ncbi:unnamed protein product [Effrenium voratum]|nr:unnamed protein product [Effrenium voratum]